MASRQIEEHIRTAEKKQDFSREDDWLEKHISNSRERLEKHIRDSRQSLEDIIKNK